LEHLDRGVDGPWTTTFGVVSSQNLNMLVAGGHIELNSDDLAVHENNSDSLAIAQLFLFGITPTAAGQVTGKLKASDGIQVWADPEMTTLLVPYGSTSESWDLFGLTYPITVFIEGVSPGDAQLDWTIQVKGTDLKPATAKVPVIILESLTVMDNNKSSNIKTNADYGFLFAGKISVVLCCRSAWLNFGSLCLP
jgi:hypothetical protein